jgi:hypothetical protein
MAKIKTYGASHAYGIKRPLKNNIRVNPRRPRSINFKYFWLEFPLIKPKYKNCY